MKLSRALAFAAVAATGVSAEFNEPIVGGTTTAASDYPFMVSLQNGGRHFCGGSLIGPSTVLTAAHCTVYSASSISIAVKGSSTNLNTNTAEVFSVRSITDHPSYSSSSSSFDFAVIELNGASSIQPVRFDTSTNQWATNPRTVSTVIGWGTTSSGGSASSRLLEVDVPLYSNADCRNTQYGNQITSSMICAGYDQGGRDSCQGDSGGPLFVGPKSDPLQVGVVSWGYGCAAANAPGVYARVTAAASFITQFTNPATSPPTSPGTPTSPPTSPPGSGECQCDGGNGRFERCDLWYQEYLPTSDPLYNVFVCLLDYSGGQSSPPTCSYPAGGELRWSSNFSRWYLNGCVGQKKVTIEETIPNEINLTGGEAASGIELPTLIGAVAGAAGAAGLVAGFVAYNMGKKAAPQNTDSLSSFRVSGEAGPFEDASEKA